MSKNKNNFQKPMFRINDEIRADRVRIVGDGIESCLLTLNEAKKIAKEKNLDLIEINHNLEIPIVKVANYDKFIYDLKKNAKKNKQHTKSLKEIQLSVNIASHDIETKVKQAKRFIEDGSKVKVTLTMRGRELVRRDENKKSLLEFITLLDGIAVPENMPKDEGNKTVVILKKRG